MKAPHENSISKRLARLRVQRMKTGLVKCFQFKFATFSNRASNIISKFGLAGTPRVARDLSGKISLIWFLAV
jgi:hypothetical protein